MTNLKLKLVRANLTYRNPIEAERHPEWVMTDYDYDQLEAHFLSENPDDASLSGINDCDTGFGEDAKLEIHMGSQDKALSLDDSSLSSFLGRTPEGTVLNISEKLDGMSAELKYEAGRLISAITRGDGEVGSSFFEVAVLIPDIPNTIPTPDKIIVRGEVLLLLKEGLAVLNELRATQVKELYSNTRNGAVGLLKSSTNLEYVHLLSFRAFDLN